MLIDRFSIQYFIKTIVLNMGQVSDPKSQAWKIKVFNNLSKKHQCITKVSCSSPLWEINQGRNQLYKENKLEFKAHSNNQKKASKLPLQCTTNQTRILIQSIANPNKSPKKAIKIKVSRINPQSPINQFKSKIKLHTIKSMKILSHLKQQPMWYSKKSNKTIKKKQNNSNNSRRINW